MRDLTLGAGRVDATNPLSFFSSLYFSALASLIVRCAPSPSLPPPEYPFENAACSQYKHRSIARRAVLKCHHSGGYCHARYVPHSTAAMNAVSMQTAVENKELELAVRRGAAFERSFLIPFFGWGLPYMTYAKFSDSFDPLPQSHT